MKVSWGKKTFTAVSQKDSGSFIVREKKASFGGFSKFWRIVEGLCWKAQRRQIILLETYSDGSKNVPVLDIWLSLLNCSGSFWLYWIIPRSKFKRKRKKFCSDLVWKVEFSKKRAEPEQWLLLSLKLLLFEDFPNCGLIWLFWIRLDRYAC